MAKSLDSIPPFVDQDQQPVTVTLTKQQARVVLSALNSRYCELDGHGDGELRDLTKAAYQSIDHQVYGVRLAREGRQEASL